jgi:uncharacterized membrane protein YphA (DoxX/SURF4 family)
LTLIVQGAASFGDWRNLRADALIVVAVTSAGGICLLAGVITPVASVLIVLVKIGFALSWLPETSTALSDGKLALLYLIAMSAAISLLGPGAFSLDAWLFGRREIIIPNPPRRS